MRAIFCAFAIALLFSAAARGDNTSVDSLELRIRSLEAQLVQLENYRVPTEAPKAEAEKQKHFEITGYIQTRYEHNDQSVSGVAGGYDVTRILNQNNFFVKRGRLKATFQPNKTSEYVLQLNAARDGVSFIDGYIRLIRKYRGHDVSLMAGQFKYPFGFEIGLSSSMRDLPERSLAERTLFRGERDRGVTLHWRAPSIWNVHIAVVQGTGIDNKVFVWMDPTIQKDVVARLRTEFGLLSIGVSGYWGETYTPGQPPKPAVPGSTVWYDANGNGIMDPDEITTSDPVPAKAATPAVVRDKIRYGADAQMKLALLPIGSTTARIEYYYADDYSSSAADLAAVSRGWYVWLSQSLGKKFGAALRYDYFDPNMHNDYAETDSFRLARISNDATGTFSVAFRYFWDSAVSLTAAYDFFWQLKDGSMYRKYSGDIKDNRFTLQFQFKMP